MTQESFTAMKDLTCPDTTHVGGLRSLIEHLLSSHAVPQQGTFDYTFLLAAQAPRVLRDPSSLPATQTVTGWSSVVPSSQSGLRGDDGQVAC